MEIAYKILIETYKMPIETYKIAYKMRKGQVIEFPDNQQK